MRSRPDYETQICAADGTRLHYREWRPEAEPDSYRGQVLIVHGYGEHGGRYSDLARRLNGAGFLVGCSDHRGMGNSEGKRGQITDYRTYVEDLAPAIMQLRQNVESKTPLFLYGHSMGGLITLLAALDGKEKAFTTRADVRGIVISAPMLRIAIPIPWWQTTMARLLAGILPGFRVPAPVRPELLTSNPEEQELARTDPLFLGFATPCWFVASEQAMARAQNELTSLNLPSLWLLPGEDRICSTETSRDVYSKLEQKPPHVLRFYDSLRHEMHLETLLMREMVLRDVASWLMTQL